MKKLVHRLPTLILVATCFWSSAAFPQTDSIPPLRKFFKIYVGIGLPVGAFSETSSSKSGYAKTGFDLGLDFSAEVTPHVMLGLLGNFAINALDAATMQNQFQGVFPGAMVTAGTWQNIWLMGSIGFLGDLNPSTSIYGKFHAGLLIGMEPDLTVTTPVASATQQSATATVNAFGFGGGLVIENKFDIGFQYLTGEPEYDITVVGTGGTFTDKYRQPTSMIQINFGYVVN